MDYAASKGAIDTLTLGLAKEVVLEGIRVNAVRAGSAHEVAKAIIWLMTDDSSYTTGSFVDVAGGR